MTKLDLPRSPSLTMSSPGPRLPCDDPANFTTRRIEPDRRVDPPLTGEQLSQRWDPAQTARVGANDPAASRSITSDLLSTEASFGPQQLKYR